MEADELLFGKGFSDALILGNGEYVVGAFPAPILSLFIYFFLSSCLLLYTGNVKRTNCIEFLNESIGTNPNFAHL